MNVTSRILYIEDEAPLAEIIRESLQSRGFEVVHTATVATAWELYRQQRPDILVVDVMLPDGDGFSLARQVRQQDLDIPIIFLTSRSLPQDVVTGFESGGNDYLKKPFSIEELIVRIRALLSRGRHLYSTRQEEDILEIGGYRFQYNACLLLHGQERIQLTAREGELLRMLCLNSNRIIDRRSLLMQIWGQDDFFTGRSLDVFITKLRKYLKADPAVKIMNVRGVGYKLVV